MGISTKRRGWALLFLAMMMVQLVPAPAAGYHQEEARVASPDPEQPPHPRHPETFPTVDAAIEDVLARHREAVRQLNDALRQKGAHPSDYAPAFPADVLVDGVDEGTRIGGVGDWTTLGGHWNARSGAGREGSAGWTIRNATTGHYGKMDTLLVSPLLDLSAYLLDSYPFVSSADGPVPASLYEGQCRALWTFAYGTMRQTNLVPDGILAALGSPCQRALRLGPASTAFSDQVVLTFAHRFDFPLGVDGAQVLLFMGQTAPDSASEGIVLQPMPGYGKYQTVGFFPAGGFTGRSDWSLAAFDLTPYAGNPVRIGFRVATSEGADVNPSYFDRLGPTPGWDLDDLRLVAPAHSHNLKVVQIDGPGYLLPGDQAYRTPPGQPVNLTVHVLNAAAGTREARVRAIGDGPENATFDRSASRVLRPGEVWAFDVSFVAPLAEEIPYVVRAQAWNPDPTGNRSLPDPTFPDNRGERPLQSAAVRRISATIAPSDVIVDDEQAVRAVATLRNDGNVPLDVAASLAETYQVLGNDTTVWHDNRTLRLDVGEERDLAWDVTSQVRKEHRLRLSASAEGAETVVATTSYYVHASPPPVFFNGAGERPDPNWTMLRANFPVPERDEGMWVARSDPFFGDPVLRALPLPQVKESAAGYTDLELSVRYVAVENNVPPRVSLAYGAPAGRSTQSSDVGIVVWNGTLPYSRPNALPMDREAQFSWRTETLKVIPSAQSGYTSEAWSLGALELHVIIQGETADNASGFFLDDLVLSGVPVGKDEAWRRPLIQVTGEPGDLAQPAQPSQCPWGPARRAINCWERVSRDEAIRISTDPRYLRWTSTVGGEPPTLDNDTALWTYVGNPGDRAEGVTRMSRDPNRLISPPMVLENAPDPMLTFDHVYAMPGYPEDGAAGKRYVMQQVVVVEVQYLREDGMWSPFYRIEPEGEYPDPLAKNSAGDDRSRSGGYLGGDGYFWPAPCEPNGVSNICEGGTTGFVRNVGDPEGNLHLIHYPPLQTQRAVFKLNAQDALEGVNLSGKTVRIGFYVPSFELHSTLVNRNNEWTVGNVRVTPVSQFAIDAAVTNATLDVPYDWRTLGVGPGTNVPINVTVSNVGRFAESYLLNVTVSELNGPVVFAPPPVSVGLLAAGENRTAILRWDVPLREDVRYVVRARVEAAADSVQDENSFNDVQEIGARGALAARTVVDLTVTSRVTPVDGRDTLSRHIPVHVVNRGNVPAHDVTLTRTIERLEGMGRVVVSTATIVLQEPVVPSGRAQRIEELRPTIEGRDYRVDDGYYLPGVVGRYLYTITASVPLGDAREDDNSVRVFFNARAPLRQDDFEDALRWTTNDQNVWDLGPGFQSAGALLAANRTSGALPPGTDAWITSPRVPLSEARAATVNVYHKFDLEHAYDGGRLEVSIDGGATWHPVPPLGDVGERVDYPVALVGSNPLASRQAPSDLVRAVSGDSRHDPAHRDGWIPASFDLMRVPALVEEVPFERLHAPSPDGRPLEQLREGLYSAAWMVTDATEEAGRWEIQNLTETVKARSGNMFWSGDARGAGARTLQRTFLLQDVEPSSTLVLSWWETRAGVTPERWQGFGGDYAVSVSQRDADGRTITLIEPNDVQRVAGEGAWSRLSVPIRSSVNLTQPLIVTFSFTGGNVGVNSMGWAIDEIDLRAVKPEGGSFRVTKQLTGGDEQDWMNWTTTGWGRVPQLAPREAHWQVVPGVTQDGVSASMWRLDLTNSKRNVDTRLVTPEVDLTRLGSARAYLRLGHDYDLLRQENKIGPGDPLWQGIAYQAAAVEVQMFNRTTGTWDAWRQLYELPHPPTDAPASRPTSFAGSDGRPYPAVLPDVGDSFEHYPRSWLQVVGPPGFSYYRSRLSESSYAFAGRSTELPYNVSEFDLSAYVGERVRFGFHAWSGGEPDGGAAIPRHWRIADVQVVGVVMSARDAELRFRLGTDASGLQGSWAIDQYEVTGVTYGRSIGVHLEERPEAVAPGGVARIRGYLQNYGPEDRRLVALGVLDAGLDRLVFPNQTVVDVGPGYAGAILVNEITRAGTNGSIVPFEILVFPGTAGGSRRMVLEVLEAGLDGGLSYGPAEDDVPGRARRVWTMEVAARNLIEISDVQPTPRYLDEPGPVGAIVSGRNAGTLERTLEGRVAWAHPNGTTLKEHPVVIGTVKPGAAFQAHAPAVQLPQVGNYTVTFTVDGATRSAFVRVGVDDVALRASFDEGALGWKTEPDSAWRLHPEGRGGRGASMLFGRNESEYALDGRGLETTTMTSGVLTTGTVDLRHASANATLSFWHRPSFNGSGRVDVVMEQAGGGCAATLTDRPLAGRSSTWQRVELPLGKLRCGSEPMLGRNVTIRFIVSMADGQGWRLDDVTLVDGPLRVSPAALEFDIVDSALKRYPFLVQNPGITPRVVDFALDADASKLTPLQKKWFTFDPERFILPPGGSAIVTLQATTPAARGAFPQSVRAALAALDASAPGERALGLLELDFAPLPRQDVQALVSAGGALLGSARSPLEEGVAHELSVTLTNLGVQASAPTSVLLQAVRDRDGLVVLEHREEIPGLAPYATSEESYVFSATWRPGFGERENFTLRVVVDPDRRQVDYDRSNDDLRLPVRVVRLVRPDLVVDPAAFLVTSGEGKRLYEAVPEALLRLEALVRNDGHSAARDVTIRVLAGNSVLKEELVPLLRPGEGYRVRVNQFAPDSTVVYRVIAFTADLELSASNNERTLEMPIYPPEIQIAVARPTLDVEPGSQHLVPVEIRNEGPHPVLLNLTVAGSGGAWELRRALVALRPGEARTVDLDVALPPNAAAGTRLVVLRAIEENVVRAQLTLPVEVAARPAAVVVPLGAQGAPSDVRVEVEVGNTGNVVIAPDVVAYGADGAELARFEVGELERGRTRLVVGAIPLPPRTPPGTLPVRLVVEDPAEGDLADAMLDAKLAKWGEVRAKAEPLSGASQGYDVRVAYDGNAPTQRRVILYGLPAGVQATVSPERLHLEPGDSATLSVRFGTSEAPAGGLYAVQLALVEDDATARPETIVPNLTALPLDLRLAMLESLGVERRGAETPRQGDTVLYSVKVRNVGDRDARDVPVALYVDGVLAARELVEDLAPGESREVTLAWTAEPGEHGVIVALDPHGRHAGDATAFSESLRVESTLPQQIAAGAAGNGLPLGVIVLSVLATLGFGYLLLRRRKA